MRVNMDNWNKIILDLCGGTGSWSKPYQEAGYDVRVITLPEHDVRTYIPPENVYGILAAPPCTEFSMAKFYHGSKCKHDFVSGLAVVDACLRIVHRAKPKFWALENPRGLLRRWLGKPRLTFHPYEYGENYMKLTDIWGEFNIPEKTVKERPEGVKKFSALLMHEIPNIEGMNLNRAARRAITPPGFARAFYEANR
jgi:hypothetical protein